MEHLASGQLLFATLALGSIYALIALGLNLIYGSMRLLNVAHGDIMIIGSYVGFWLLTLAAIPPFLSMWMAMAVAAGLGAIIYLGVFRRVIANTEIMDRLEANSLLVFFGLSVVLQNLMSLAFTPDNRGYAYFDRVLSVGGVSFGADRLMMLVTALAATIACVLFFRLSRTGLAIRALIQQRDAARLVGIPADRINLIVFSLGFALAALAGCLIGTIEQVSPFSGFPYTIAAFIVIILGGLGNLAGGLIGAFVLAAVEVYGVALTSASLRSLLVYGVFIAILLLRPQGLFGKRRAA